MGRSALPTRLRSWLDNHLGYGVLIGAVVAYRDAISPTGVGFDIGCGNKAVCVDMPGSELRGPDKQSVDMRHFESGGWPLSE